MKLLHTVPVALLLPFAAAAFADQSVEGRLRDSLRNTMLQLREAQNQVATMQATQMQNEAQIQDLTTRLEQAQRQIADEQDVSRKSIADLNQRVTEREKEIGSLRVELSKWQKAQQQAAQVARETEAKRAKLQQENIGLQRRVEEQHRQNMEMHRIGKEILDRYERFGLGDALLAREPFVGTTRVKFQNLVQDYGDQLADQRITDFDPAAHAPPAASPAEEPAPEPTNRNRRNR